MTDFADLGLRVDSQPLRVARDELGRLTRAGATAEGALGRNTDRITAGWRRMASIAGSAAGVITAALGFRALGRGSAEVATITNRFLGMGQSAEQAAASLATVAGIAERTRAPLAATAELYSRLGLAAEELGASQADIARFTENVGLALAASGTGAAQASGALLQLSQAMAGGVVRAEEFNSILEGAFPIAQAAARGIDAAGGSVGRLRQLVAQGKVSSEEFFRAILSQSDALEAAFGRTVPTVAQAMTVLGGSVALAAAAVDSATGASAGLAQAIIAVAGVVRQAGDLFVSINDAIGGFQGYIIAAAGVLTATSRLW